MAKILFINPIVREEDVPRHIPYGIALLAAISMNRGHLVQVFDANAWRVSDEVLPEICGADDWDVFAIGGLTTTYGHIKKIVSILKGLRPDIPIIAGGGFLTSMPRDIMRWLPQIDYGIVGEAFETFPELVEELENNKTTFHDISKIKELHIGLAMKLKYHLPGRY